MTAPTEDRQSRIDRVLEEVRRWATVVLVVLVAALGWRVEVAVQTAHQNRQSSEKSITASDRAADAADQAKGAADKAASAAADVDSGVAELVAFVHELQNQPDTSAALVDKILTILCASSDPVRIQVCAAFGIPTDGGP